jgi:asparagine synthase (glutamine-hydrolysing)
MCGIAGILNADCHRPVDPALLRRMADAIAHRGPDADGFWHAPGVGLAHRRLSIIDLSGGDQPIGNEDGAVQVVFNGEIYNFRELRRGLEQRGHVFRTHSDTEVIVHLYEELGEQLVEQLRGMFAFALWDGSRRRLLLARDRLGLKPLYYCRTSTGLFFASEMKSLLACPEVPRTVDPEALEDYLAFGVVPGETSIFRGIHKLPPAHTLLTSAGDALELPRRYWSLNAEPDESRTVDAWCEAICAKFTETVDAHRMADVPIGAFLSGGLDSSAVVAALSQSHHEPVRTFSIGFHEGRFSELPHARRVAAHFGTQHVEEIVTPQAAAGLDDLVKYFDEPFADASAIPTLYVARVARQYVKVALSGDGGDEAFGGYARYAHDLREAAVRRRLPRAVRNGILHPLSRIWPKADWLPRRLRLRTALANLSMDAAHAYANTISLCRMPLRRRLLHGDIRAALNGHRPEERVVEGFGAVNGDALRGMISADVEMLLPDDFLTKVDRASMAVGLEVRPPLVDHELFKQVCPRSLPADVIDRPKQGFDLPVDDWLRGPLRDQFHAYVLEPSAAVAAYLDQSVAASLYESHRRRTGRHGAQLWSLLVLGAWSDRYLRAETPSTTTANRVEATVP